MIEFRNNVNPRLTVLSFGAGQDSTAILYMLLRDKSFRKKYAPNDLVVVMANTGNEHRETYDHVDSVSKICKSEDVPFYLIGLDQHTPKSWRNGLIKFYEVGNRVGSKCFPKTCTDNLKIKPIYNWLEQYVYDNYMIITPPGRKKALKAFAAKYGKIRVLLGIARGEEKRASTNEESPHAWMRQTIDKVYPLIDLSMDRQACQDYIQSIGAHVPLPSNCILCPFMSEQELLYLHRAMPKWYDKWVELEAAKIEANKHVENNMGVWGKKLLPQKLKDAQEKYGHMTTEQLREYKMSHGHCVMSKY